MVEEGGDEEGGDQEETHGYTVYLKLGFTCTNKVYVPTLGSL
jgi:hypothetical protein